MDTQMKKDIHDAAQDEWASGYHETPSDEGVGPEIPKTGPPPDEQRMCDSSYPGGHQYQT